MSPFLFSTPFLSGTDANTLGLALSLCSDTGAFFLFKRIVNREVDFGTAGIERALSSEKRVLGSSVNMASIFKLIQ
jgi:hypothetical protein